MSDNDSILEWMGKNSEKILEDLEQMIKQSEVINNGIGKVRDSVLNNSSDKNTRKQLYVTMKSVATLSKMIRKLALINIILVSGKNFIKDINTDDFSKNPEFNNIFGGIFNK